MSETPFYVDRIAMFEISGLVFILTCAVSVVPSAPGQSKGQSLPQHTNSFPMLCHGPLMHADPIWSLVLSGVVSKFFLLLT